MLVPKTKNTNIRGGEAPNGDESTGDSGDALSKNEVLESFDRGMREMLDGKTRPALEFLDELDRD